MEILIVLLILEVGTAGFFIERAIRGLAGARTAHRSREAELLKEIAALRSLLDPNDERADATIRIAGRVISSPRP